MLTTPPLRRHPLNGEPIRPIAYLGPHRRPLWPIMGASEPPPEPPPPGPPSGGPQLNANGYPDNTPVTEMETAHQAAYWKHQSRKHEARAEARKDYDTVKAERDRLKTAGQTEQEAAAAAARSEGEQAAAQKYGTRLVAAEFRAAAAGRIVNGTPLDVAELVQGINASYYLTDTGEVDTDKVTRFLDGIAPSTSDTGNTPPPRRFPDLGQGRQPATPTSKRDAGVAEAQKRFPAKTTT